MNKVSLEFSKLNNFFRLIIFQKFAIIIIIPLLWFTYSNETSFILKALILNFATAVAISVYCVPKIRSAYYYTKVLYNKKDSSDPLVNPLNKGPGGIICPNCGAFIDNDQFSLQE